MEGGGKSLQISKGGCRLQEVARGIVIIQAKNTSTLPLLDNRVVPHYLSIIRNMSSSFILRTPTTAQRSSQSVLLSCPPPPSIHRRHHDIDMERRLSIDSTMTDISNNNEGDEQLVGFILVAPLGSTSFVQRASSSNNNSNIEAQNMVSVPTKVLRPRPSSSSSFE